MEEAPKKKKKYTKKVAANVEESKPASVAPVVPKIEGESLQRSRFDYDFEQIVNHLLVKLLPAQGFTIRLSEKLIFGVSGTVDPLLEKLDQNVKMHSGVLLELAKNSQKDDLDYEKQEHYGVQLFSAKFFERITKGFFMETRYERDYQQFFALFASGTQRLYLLIKKQFLGEYLEKIQRHAVRVKLEGEDEVPKQLRGNRRILKTKVTTIDIKADDLDMQEMKKFFRYSKKTEEKDLQITETRGITGKVTSYTINLLCFEAESKIKLEGFNYYFRFEEFMNLPLGESKHKNALLREYTSLRSTSATVTFVKGYKSSKWDEKNLLYKIRHDQISSKWTNYTNEYFQALHMVGLLPKIKELIQELEKALNEVPMDEIKEEVFLDFSDQIVDALRNSKAAEDFVEQYIIKHFEQYNDVCKLQKVKFPLRGVKIELLVASNKERQFKDIEFAMNKIMVKQISIQSRQIDFPVNEELLKMLANEGFVVVSYSKKDFKYLETNDRISSSSSKIQNILNHFQCISEAKIEVKGRVLLQKSQNIIKQLRKMPDFSRIHIPEPVPVDKITYCFSFYGPKAQNQLFKKKVTQKMEQIRLHLGEYYEIVDEKIARLLNEQQKFSQILQKDLNISLIVTQNRKIEAKIDIKSKSVSIIILKSVGLERVPIDSTVVFSGKEQLSRFQQKYLAIFKTKANVAKDGVKEQVAKKNLTLLFTKQQQDSEAFCRLGLNNLNQRGNLVMIMPVQKKKEFIHKAISTLLNTPILQKFIHIYFVELDSAANIEEAVGLPDSSLGYQQKYILQWSCQNLAYTKSGNDKINDAIANRQDTVILQRQDLAQNADQTTHVCNMDKMTITSIKNVVEIPFRAGKNSYVFTFNGRQFVFPQSQKNIVNYHKVSLTKMFYLSIPYYEIDLKKLQQRNIFSGYTRPIKSRQVQIPSLYNGEVEVRYNVKVSQLAYSYDEQKSAGLKDACERVETFVKSRLISREVDLKGCAINPDFKLRIAALAQRCQVECTWERGLVVSCYEQKDINDFITMVDFEINYLKTTQMSIQKKFVDQTAYPSEWEPQENEIATYQVKKGTLEFIEVEKLFTVRPIHSLMRIQNKYIYKKYSEEKKHLTHNNDGREPKEMKLFHGTGQTSPSSIYEDKDDGFNINYSSETNLLGRGVYFAQKSEYSISYASPQPTILGGVQLYSMFLCLVMVGDSQDMVMCQTNKDVKDTQFKNKEKRIRYQSMKGSHSICDIYVVYKNRRAYPLYLIRFKH